MTEETVRRLLMDARQQLADARAEIGQAIVALESAADSQSRLRVEELLGEAGSRLSILDGEIARYLEGHSPEARTTGRASSSGSFDTF